MPRAPRIQLTDRHITDTEKLAALGLTQVQIAQFFGWSERTFRHRVASSEALATAYKKGRAKALATVSARLWDNIRQGDRASIFFYLKCQGGWRETGGDV